MLSTENYFVPSCTNIVDSIDLTALRTTAVVIFPNEVTLKKTSA